MDKRGQVTVFVIVGVVIVIIAVLIFYLRDSGQVVVPGLFLSADAKKAQIEENLRNCVQESVRPVADMLGKQGGDLNPVNYRLYKDAKVPYLCLNMPGKTGCYNVMPPIRIVEARLKDNVQGKIAACVDQSLVSGEDVKGTKELKVDVKLVKGGILVATDYDVTLVNNNVELPIGRVETTIEDVPFVELYEASHDIVNSEAITGDFENLFYMLQKRGLYEVRVDRPYPDKIYILNKRDSDYQLWFAIQGEATTSAL